jgi:hypothetical protein
MRGIGNTYNHILYIHMYIYIINIIYLNYIYISIGIDNKLLMFFGKKDLKTQIFYEFLWDLG